MTIALALLNTSFYLPAFIYIKSATWQFPLHCSIFIQGNIENYGLIRGSNVNFMNMKAM